MLREIKKVAGLLFSQSVEQKDIMLLKLSIISYNSKRDAAYTRLGELLFKAYQEGDEDIAQNEKIQKEIAGLEKVQKAVARINDELKALREKSADGREAITQSFEETWEQTRERFGTPAPPAGDAVDARHDEKTPAPNGAPGTGATMAGEPKTDGEIPPNRVQ